MIFIVTSKYRPFVMMLLYIRYQVNSSILMELPIENDSFHCQHRQFSISKQVISYE
jgi:hypothetical protein